MRKRIKGFKTLPGKHCITASLKQVFNYYGHPLSEEMLFGLGSGLNFFYLDFKIFPYPQIGGRIKVGELEENLAEALGIKISINKTSSTRKAYQGLQNLIESNNPVMVYVDMAYLDYLGLPPESHFGGHSIVVFGLDEEKGLAYVSDRDGENYRVTNNPEVRPADWHTIRLEDLARARGSKFKPFPPNNLWLELDFSGIQEITTPVLKKAIRKNMESMLNPPMRKLGIKGIKVFADEVVKWADFPEEKLKWAAFNGYIMIDQIGGTGGGAFRHMYGDFLRQTAEITGDKKYTRAGQEYINISEEWDRLAVNFFKIFEQNEPEILHENARILTEIYQREKTLWEEIDKII